MTVYFFDTSALAKRYIVETGSLWVASLFDPQAGQIPIISELLLVEISSLLTRYQQEGNLSASSVTTLKAAVLLHAARSYLVVPVDSDVIALARSLIDRHLLRTLDSIQLACAMRASVLLQTAVTFVSADQKLLSAASAEQFQVENPNLRL